MMMYSVALGMLECSIFIELTTLNLVPSHFSHITSQLKFVLHTPQVVNKHRYERQAAQVFRLLMPARLKMGNMQPKNRLYAQQNPARAAEQAVIGRPDTQNF